MDQTLISASINFATGDISCKELKFVSVGQDGAVYAEGSDGEKLTFENETVIGIHEKAEVEEEEGSLFVAVAVGLSRKEILDKITEFAKQVCEYNLYLGEQKVGDAEAKLAALQEEIAEGKRMISDAQCGRDRVNAVQAGIEAEGESGGIGI